MQRNHWDEVVGMEERLKKRKKKEKERYMGESGRSSFQKNKKSDNDRPRRGPLDPNKANKDGAESGPPSPEGTPPIFLPLC